MESLQQSVSLGKDSFTKGRIEKTTIEQCVKTLRGFGKLLQEYGITGSDKVRAVATAAVREATNREEFIERMHIGSGIVVDAIDAADAARLNYLGIQPFLGKDLLLKRSHVLIAEIGGGSTEVCFLKREGTAFIQAYRLGSLRLREMLEAFHVPSISQTDLMESDIMRIVAQIKQRVSMERPLTFIALGGDIRFAASQILQQWDAVNPVALPVAALERFTAKVNALSVQKLAHKYYLPYMEAETAGPALLFYLKLSKALHLKRIIVAGVSMRHGLFMEMGKNGVWTEELKDIIARSALSIAAKYQTDIAHVKHVERICLEFSTRLRPNTSWDRGTDFCSWSRRCFTISAFSSIRKTTISIRNTLLKTANFSALTGAISESWRSSPAITGAPRPVPPMLLSRSFPARTARSCQSWRPSCALPTRLTIRTVSVFSHKGYAVDDTGSSFPYRASMTFQSSRWPLKTKARCSRMCSACSPRSGRCTKQTSDPMKKPGNPTIFQSRTKLARIQRPGPVAGFRYRAAPS